MWAAVTRAERGELEWDCIERRETCQTVHHHQLRRLGEPRHCQDQHHGQHRGQEDHREQLRPGVGHLGNDQLAADVGEHRPRQEEHATRVEVKDFVGRPADPDEEQEHRYQG